MLLSQIIDKLNLVGNPWEIQLADRTKVRGCFFLSPMTLLEFAPTATRTRIIASRFGKRFLQLCLLCRQDKHHLGRGPIAAQQLGHDAHRFIDMVEERFVSRA